MVSKGLILVLLKHSFIFFILMKGLYFSFKSLCMPNSIILKSSNIIFFNF